MKLEELINKHYDQLNANDFHIWNYISNNKHECQKMAIDQLAYKCNVSRTTILRFAQKISLKGYSELKLYLKLSQINLKKREHYEKQIPSPYYFHTNIHFLHLLQNATYSRCFYC